MNLNSCRLSILILFYLIFSTFDLHSQVSIFKQKGKAVFYSDRLKNRITTSGEKYDKNINMAAHSSLPMESVVLVTNTQNYKKVFVVVKDRLPKNKNNVIKLSKKTATTLGVSGSTPINVILKSFLIDEPKTPNKVKNAPKTNEISQNTEEKKHFLIPDNSFFKVSIKKQTPYKYGVQLGLYKNVEYFFTKVSELENKGLKDIFVNVRYNKNKAEYRIFSGNFASKKQAVNHLMKIKKLGFVGFVINYEQF